MPHSPKTSSLAAVTHELPGADDAVDRRDARLRQAVGHRPDRLGAAGDDEHVHADEPGRSEQRLVELAVRVRGRRDHDRAHAGDLGRNHAHQQRAGIGRRTARGVDPDTRQRHPAPLDLDAGDDRRGPGLRQFRLGEAADVRDHLLEAGPDARRQGVAGGLHLGAADQQRAVGPPAAEPGVGVADGRIATGLDGGEDGAGVLADARVRHGAAPQKSRDLGRDGRVSGSPGRVPGGAE